MLEFIAVRDHRVMHRVNNWRAPHWIRVWALCATRGGDGWLWYIMLAAVMLFGGDLRWPAIATCVTAAVAGIGLFVGLKRTAKRRRPCAIAAHCWATLLPPDQFSFPSGHTITAFAVAAPLSLFYPSLMVGLFFCAISIGISRILLGMHFLSDVLAGCAVGSALGYTCYLLYV